MKNKLFLIALLGLVTASCASSCSSCSENLPPTSPVVEQPSGDGGTSSVPSSLPQEVSSAEDTCIQVDGNLECNPHHASSSSGGAPSPETGIVQGDTWQISVPPQFKNKTPSQKNIVLSKVSEEDRVLLVLLEESYHGTYDDYTLGSVRSFKEGGASVVSNKSLEMNGSKFLSLEVMKGDIKILNLISYSSNKKIYLT